MAEMRVPRKSNQAWERPRNSDDLDEAQKLQRAIARAEQRELRRRARQANKKAVQAASKQSRQHKNSWQSNHGVIYPCHNSKAEQAARRRRLCYQMQRSKQHWSQKQAEDLFGRRTVYTIDHRAYKMEDVSLISRESVGKSGRQAWGVAGYNTQKPIPQLRKPIDKSSYSFELAGSGFNESATALASLSPPSPWITTLANHFKGQS